MCQACPNGASTGNNRFSTILILKHHTQLSESLTLSVVVKIN